MRHKPVLLNEVVDMLNCKPGKNYVDCTVGMGGHTEAILQKTGKGKIVGIDCDEAAVQAASESLKRFGDRFIPVHDNFANIESVFEKLNIRSVDGILFDLGVSLNQLNDPSRGFSFMKEGPLDMRMDVTGKETADELVNRLPESKLAQLLEEFGEDRASRRIAKRIVRMRARNHIGTTKELADIVSSVYPRRCRIHPATRTFQALRIAVNRELEAIKTVLEKASCLLSTGGRICVISYHSLEDRIVKREFLRLSNEAPGKVKLLVLTKKPIVPSREEVLSNRRSRSAKMRVAERI